MDRRRDSFESGDLVARDRRFAVASRLLLSCGILAATSRPSLASPNQEACAVVGGYGGFAHPARVTIRGYSADAMEPFISRDGRYLFFNNLNDPSVNTNLFYASQAAGGTFAFRSEIQGVNSPALDAVATMDRVGHFYFVSNRSYTATLSTIYTGRFQDGRVSGIGLVPGLSPRRRGIVDFDVEVSADGNTLYVAQGSYGPNGGPNTAELVIAARHGATFAPLAGGRILANVNTGGLNYAAALSVDERELFFTRIDPRHPGDGPKVYRASRQLRTESFGCPQRLLALTGNVEAPSLSSDGRSLYYHKRMGSHSFIYRVTR